MNSKSCRACSLGDVKLIYDFGFMPLANHLPTDISRVSEHPLKLWFCFSCGLGQVDDFVSPLTLFTNYRYTTSTSSTFLQHAANYVRKVRKGILPGKDVWILEIASNDGYLLQEFKKIGYRVMGIDPAENIALIGESKGIDTIKDFFSSALAEAIVSEYGSPSLIIANNVLAHVPDINDFIRGLGILSGKKTIISIENPSILGILLQNHFDTIYHEHFSYLSVNAVVGLTTDGPLEVFDVEHFDIHGGTNRYWLRQKETGVVQNQSTVSNAMLLERKSGLFELRTWQRASDRISMTINSFKKFLESRDTPILGYGAPAKASTLINATHVDNPNICAIVDSGVEKQGRFFPRYGIPVVSPHEVQNFKFEEIGIFPWNILEEIQKDIHQLGLHNKKQFVFMPRLIEV